MQPLRIAPIGARPVLKANEMAALIPDGATLLIAGFLGVGSPHALIDALIAVGRKELTLITNDTARPGIGVAKLIEAKSVRKLLASHIGTNPETQRQMIAGELEVELVPQGTLVERIRAGGFGLGGVLTKTGLGTLVEKSKQVLEIQGERWLLDLPIKADFALIHAHRADAAGNLTYRYTADNFNSVMAMAGQTVFAEADELVPIGDIAPDDVRTPGAVVTYLVTRGHS